MDAATVFFVCVMLLVVTCLVLDRWVFPRMPEPPSGSSGKPSSGSDGAARESRFEYAMRQIQDEWLRKHRNSNPFRIHSSIVLDGGCHYLVATCSGKIPWHEKGWLYASLELADVTDGSCKQVLSIHAQMRDPATGQFACAPARVFPSDGFIDSSFELMRIPLESLTAPLAGRRNLRLRCVLAPANSVPEDVATRCEVDFEADLTNPGYEDLLGEGRALIQSLELAMACALAGRTRLGPALKLLGTWVDRALYDAKEAKAPYYEDLREAFDHLWSEGLPEGYVVDVACVVLAAARRATVDDALELCVQASTADDRWPREAVVLIRRIAKLIGLSSAEIQALIDRHLLASSVSLDGCDWESLTDMNPSWDSSKIRRHLAVQFDRWNSRAPSVRTTAEQARLRSILEAIAMLRQKYA